MNFALNGYSKLVYIQLSGFSGHFLFQEGILVPGRRQCDYSGKHGVPYVEPNDYSVLSLPSNTFSTPY